MQLNVSRQRRYTIFVSNTADVIFKLHVFFCLSFFSCSTARTTAVADCVQRFLQQSNKTIFGDICVTEFEDEFLSQHVQAVSICDTDLVLGCGGNKPTVSLAEAQLDIHVFQLHEDEGPAAETIDEQDEEISAASHWLLPSG